MRGPHWIYLMGPAELCPKLIEIDFEACGWIFVFGKACWVYVDGVRCGSWMLKNQDVAVYLKGLGVYVYGSCKIRNKSSAANLVLQGLQMRREVLQYIVSGERDTCYW